MVHENDFNRIALAYFEDLKSDKYKPLDKDTEKELLLKAKNGDENAQKCILEANVRFVFDVAKRYKNKGVPLTELIAEGNMGLIKAIEKFDTDRDVKFITYGVWWVRNYMCDLIERKKNEQKMLEYGDGISSTIRGNPQLFDEEDTYEFQEEMDEADEVYEENDTYNMLDRLISSINQKERDVIIAYFGIGDNHPKTLQEIAEEMNVSSERVRQIKVIALRKMKSMALAYSMAEKI